MKKIPMDIVMLQIMEQYHRSYKQYDETPVYIIELIIEKNNIDATLSKLNSK